MLVLIMRGENRWLCGGDWTDGRPRLFISTVATFFVVFLLLLGLHPLPCDGILYT
jgi:hypothetical protein